MSKKPIVAETVSSDVPTTGTGTHYLNADQLALLAKAEKVIAAQNRWREANKDKVAGYQKKWRASNPDKVKEAHKKYQARNPEKVKAWHKKAQDRQRAILREAKELLKNMKQTENVS